MKLSALFLIMLALVGLMVLVPAPVSAQLDCGEVCEECGDQKYEGQDWHEIGEWDMDCPMLGGMHTCSSCQQPLIGDVAPATPDILRLIAAASLRELPGVVSKHRDVLLLSASRRVLVVQGGACNKETLSGLVFLNEAQTDAILRAGVRSLEHFMAEQDRLANVAITRTTGTGYVMTL